MWEFQSTLPYLRIPVPWLVLIVGAVLGWCWHRRWLTGMLLASFIFLMYHLSRIVSAHYATPLYGEGSVYNLYVYLYVVMIVLGVLFRHQLVRLLLRYPFWVWTLFLCLLAFMLRAVWGFHLLSSLAETGGNYLNLKNDRMISVHFQGKLFNITVIQVYAPTSNAEEAEVEWFYEDLQDFLELTPKKDVLFIMGDWNAKVGSQEIPGVTGKFGFGVQNEAGQRLIEFCQENALVIANTLFQ